jgi:hypothetical protein
MRHVRYKRAADLGGDDKRNVTSQIVGKGSTWHPIPSFCTGGDEILVPIIQMIANTLFEMFIAIISVV